ncbi:hypothetical protein KFZ70_06880 [Tamlana fucoidanivorans]
MIGSWKMVYADVLEDDSIQTKDLTHTAFIKIINQTHFAFFNQSEHGNDLFYSGAGTYVLEDNTYTETLDYTTDNHLKSQKFIFKVQFIGDTLVQSGVEQIETAGINRTITEKYIRIN